MLWVFHVYNSSKVKPLAGDLSFAQCRWKIVFFSPDVLWTNSEMSLLVLFLRKVEEASCRVFFSYLLPPKNVVGKILFRILLQKNAGCFLLCRWLKRVVPLGIVIFWDEWELKFQLPLKNSWPKQVSRRIQDLRCVCSKSGVEIKATHRRAPLKN